MKWKKVDAKTWESHFSEKFDFVVTKEKNRFILDLFDNRIKNNSEAYITSFELRSLKEAKHDAESYL